MQTKGQTQESSARRGRWKYAVKADPTNPDGFDVFVV